MSSFRYLDQEVFYQVDGEGEAILLLNGIMMSTKSWTPFVPSLSQNNQLIRVDFFDQGQSAKKVKDAYTQELQVGLVKALLDHLNLSKVSVVGISYGGEVALLFAIRYSELIHRLVLFNTTAYTSPWLKEIGESWIKSGKTRDGEHYYQTTIPIIYSPHFYETNLPWMKKRQNVLVPIFSNGDFLDQMERLTRSAESFDVRQELDKIQAPTLIVSAEMDYLTPVDNQEMVFRAIKHSDWIKIPFAGHASMYEKPMLFTSLVLGYVNVRDHAYVI